MMMRWIIFDDVMIYDGEKEGWLILNTLGVGSGRQPSPSCRPHKTYQVYENENNIKQIITT